MMKIDSQLMMKTADNKMKNPAKMMAGFRFSAILLENSIVLACFEKTGVTTVSKQELDDSKQVAPFDGEARKESWLCCQFQPHQLWQVQ
jgi:hypothetical protein